MPLRTSESHAENEQGGGRRGGGVRRRRGRRGRRRRREMGRAVTGMVEKEDVGRGAGGGYMMRAEYRLGDQGFDEDQRQSRITHVHHPTEIFPTSVWANRSTSKLPAVSGVVRLHAQMDPADSAVKGATDALTRASAMRMNSSRPYYRFFFLLDRRLSSSHGPSDHPRRLAVSDLQRRAWQDGQLLRRILSCSTSLPSVASLSSSPQRLEVVCSRPDPTEFASMIKVTEDRLSPRQLEASELLPEMLLPDSYTSRSSEK
eukprot:768026-Hanusia_phi.AAC.4